MNVRLLPTPTATQTISSRDGFRSYAPVLGTPVDAPRQDVELLTGNGWVAVGIGGGRGSPEPAQAGATSARPTSAGVAIPLQPGSQYVDTTLGKIIVWDGATWRDYAGSAV